MKFPIKTIRRGGQITAFPKNSLEVSKLVKFSNKYKFYLLVERLIEWMAQNLNLKKLS